MITFVLCALFITMANSLLLFRRPISSVSRHAFRQYDSFHLYKKDFSLSRGEEVPASLSRRTTLATVEEMVLRSVHSMLSENEKNLEVSGKLNPMVFLGRPEFGDYQCNIALSLSKQLQMKPRDVAQKLMVSMMLQKDNDVVEKMDISGPGFINIHISSQYLQRKLQDMVGDSATAFVVTNEKKNEVNRLGIPKVSKPQKIVVDFSSPNIAKEMHVGHLRSTIIGDSLARVLEFLGHSVLRLNHVGDWGTQFGMLIHYLKTHHPAALLPSSKSSDSGGNSNGSVSGNTSGSTSIGAGAGETEGVTAAAQQGQQQHLSVQGQEQQGQGQGQLGEIEIGDLVEFYKAAKRCFDTDPTFKEASRREVVLLQAGDPDSLAAWTAICNKSRLEFQQIYDLLKVNLTERGESFYNPLLPGLVRRLKESGVVQTSEGAECIFVEGFKNSDGSPLPLIVQKSDGGYLYATTDLAALHHRVHQEGADRVIYVTDAGQAQHFNMVFKAAELAGILTLTNKTQGRDRDRDSGDIEGNDTNDTIGITIQKQKKEVQLTHVPFGLVLGEDGKKIKSRSGDSVKLRELLDEAVRLAAQNEAARIAATGAALAAGVETPTLGQAGDVVNIINALDGNRTLDLQQRARIIGLGAVKYADLSMHRESSYKFSFNKMLSLSGNTAPYMLYAYVRIRGIQRRAAESLLSVQSAPTALPAQSSQMNALLQLEKPAEAALGKQLVRFHEVLLEVADSLCPNKLCEYMFELAQRFNQFYESCPVLQAETPELRASRAALCALTADTLKLSLDLLGIETVERM